MANSGWTIWNSIVLRSIPIACALTSTVAFMSYGPGVQAQKIMPDESLGDERSVVTFDRLDGTIEGGAERGSNLFHSFSEFNIGQDQRVYFANPANISNILSRVTGATSVSIIDGLLGVDGAANLFLLNPNGIVFGPEARLDIDGSFTASTAESIVFENGEEFRATTNLDSSLLSMDVPLGVQFNVTPRGNLINQGNLAVGEGQTISLFGNNVSTNVRLAAPGGEVRVLGSRMALIDGDISEDADFDNALDTLLTPLLGDMNIIFQALDGITIEDVKDDELRFPSGTGQIIFAGDANADGIGDVVMRDVQDVLQTSNRDLIISGVNFVLGRIDTANDELFSVLPIFGVDEGGPIPSSGTTGTATFIFTVPDEPNYRVDDLDVRFSAEHTWNADLDVVLVSPNGTRLELFSDVGADGDNFQDTLLDDDVDTLISDGSAPFNGSFRPEGNGGLAIFDGENSAGTWTLEVIDDFPSEDSGTLFEFGDEAPWGSAQGTSLEVTTILVGDSGSVKLDAQGDISVESIDTDANIDDRNGGVIELNAQRNININGFLDSSAESDSFFGDAGNGGNISLIAGKTIAIGGSVNSSSVSNSGNTGAGGNIVLSSKGGMEFRGSVNSSSFSESGNAEVGGRIQVSSAEGDISIGTRFNDFGPFGIPSFTQFSSNASFNSSSSSMSGAASAGGEIILSASEGHVTTSGALNSSSSSQSDNAFDNSGTGGAIRINAGEIIWIDDGLLSSDGGFLNSSSSSQSGNSGTGGAISLSSIRGISIDGRGLNSSSSSQSGNSGIGGAISLITEGNIRTNQSLNSSSSSQSGNAGAGGNISLSSRRKRGGISFSSSIDSFNSSSSSSSGNAGTGGAISILSAGIIDGGIGNVDSSSSSNSGNSGAGGMIKLVAGNYIDLFGAPLNSSSSSSQSGNAGTGGEIFISSAESSIDLEFTDLDSSSSSFVGDSDGGGAITLVSKRDIDLLGGGGGTLNSSSLSRISGNSGDGGGIILSSTEGGIQLDGFVRLTPSMTQDFFSISALDSSSFSNSGNAGSGGDISLVAQDSIVAKPAIAVPNSELFPTSEEVQRRLAAFSNAGLAAYAITQGDDSTRSGAGGAITLQAGDRISNFEVLTVSSDGISGNTNIQGSGDLSLENIRLTTSTRIQTPDPSNPGEFIEIDVSNSSQSGTNVIQSLGGLTLNDVQILSEANSTSPAGDITVSSPTSIILSNGSQINSNTNSNGPGGDIFLETPQVTLGSDSAITASANETSSGTQGGSITFISPNENLTIQGSGVIAVDTQSNSRAGDLNIDAFQVTIDEIELSASTNSDGPGGNVTLNTEKIRFNNGGQIEASTSGAGNGGNIIFNPPGDTLNIQGNGTLSVETSGSGNAGTFTDVENFRAENFIVDIPNITIDQARLSAETSSSQPGGDITFNTAQLSVVSGGEISTATSSAGSGGNITLNTDNIILDNSGTISASASTTSTGQGGSLTVDSDNNPLTIQGNGVLTVSSNNTNSEQSGGNLRIDASTLALRRGAQLSVNSSSKKGGGNIDIDTSGNIALSGNSFINATSTNENAGDGGNIFITIDDGFLIGAPGQDNDIIANAVGGNGGTIDITALRLFGFTQRDETNVEVLRSNSTNDISASTPGGLPGQIALNTLAIDPAQGLNELPLNLSDNANQIAAGCRANANDTDQSEFVVTGRGGLPNSPSDPLSANLDTVPWVTSQELESSESPISAVPVDPSPPPSLQEAQGWTTKANGEIFFVIAPSTDVSSYASGIPTGSLCAADIDL